jgi:hypothetical protein
MKSNDFISLTGITQFCRMYRQHKMRKSPTQITCGMYSTIHHHANKKSTNKSIMPAKWLESTNVFAMPVQNDILPCVKDKDIQPYALYEAMPVSLH